MTDIPERDKGLLGLVERLMKRPEPATVAQPAVIADDDLRGGLDPVMPETKPAASLEPELTIETTRRLTRDQLTAAILRAMTAIDGCPARGFEITVYGARPWNALLRITPAAGRVDAARWRDRLQQIVLLFREQYELVEDDAPPSPL